MVSMQELVGDFESLGDNCEFGIVQRSYGAEPWALFRWVGINHIDQLIIALNARFEGLGDPEYVAHEMLPGWDHYAAMDRKYGFYFHTTLDPSKVSDQPDAIRRIAAIEGDRLKFLAGHLLSSMESGKKILVYRQKRAPQEVEVRRLFDAINRIGRNTLLLVIEDDRRPPGSIEDKGNGLILAYVGKLSNENPPQVDFDAWQKILITTHSLWVRSRAGDLAHNLAEVPLRGIFDQTLTTEPGALLSSFESLGDGREFGIAQRFVGIEPEGLFRFASLRHGALKALLESRFDGLADASGMHLGETEDEEFVVAIAEWGLKYHTGVWKGQLSRDEVLSRERIRLRFYAGKMLDDLASGDKILIRFDDEIQIDDVRQLFAALNKFGPNRLLWVDRAPTPELVGTIQRLGLGLVRGYVAERSAFSVPTPHALSIWLRLALDARELLICERNGGLTCTGGRWIIPNHVTTEISEDVRGGSCGHKVFKHSLTVDASTHNADALVYHVASELRSGALYTISTWVWIPADFAGSNVAMVALGFPSLRGWVADLSKRDQWQHIITSFRQPVDQISAAPALRVIGPAGSILFTTGWRLDEGAVPRTYLA